MDAESLRTPRKPGCLAIGALLENAAIYRSTGSSENSKCNRYPERPEPRRQGRHTQQRKTKREHLSGSTLKIAGACRKIRAKDRLTVENTHLEAVRAGRVHGILWAEPRSQSCSSAGRQGLWATLG
ncbi:hypothetical protein BAV1245 [Bordetella avium 197N]|uniref:Uncharacterized protein n=1 Tax=Bordetella avium (strain 197N) TaxID=360910 RepID=Q2L335_BORA1|nr:hypothetical protein BAV1245 [Bordetella avium 197N]